MARKNILLAASAAGGAGGGVEYEYDTLSTFLSTLFLLFFNSKLYSGGGGSVEYEYDTLSTFLSTFFLLFFLTQNLTLVPVVVWNMSMTLSR